MPHPTAVVTGREQANGAQDSSSYLVTFPCQSEDKSFPEALWQLSFSHLHLSLAAYIFSEVSPGANPSWKELFSSQAASICQGFCGEKSVQEKSSEIQEAHSTQPLHASELWLAITSTLYMCFAKDAAELSVFLYSSGYNNNTE